MDEVYVDKVKCVENYLKRINPLAFVLEKDVLNELMMSSELLDINGEQKKSIKKKYLEWCRKVHPDKTNDVDEDSMYICI